MNQACLAIECGGVDLLGKKFKKVVVEGERLLSIVQTTQKGFGTLFADQ